jgi:nicotinate dehydrogenase subunit A
VKLFHCPSGLDSRAKPEATCVHRLKRSLAVMVVSLTVNGTVHSVTADLDTPLLYVLRNDLGLNAAKFGCGLGQCGACTVLIDGAASRSCVMPIGALAQSEITTLEGLGTLEQPHPLQSAFMAEQAAQCGYCIAGMVMRAQALLERNPRPSEREIREAMAVNLCRCGTHMRILAAVRRASAQAVKS